MFYLHKYCFKFIILDLQNNSFKILELGNLRGKRLIAIKIHLHCIILLLLLLLLLTTFWNVIDVRSFSLEDVLKHENGECVICLEDLSIGMKHA